MKPAHASPCPLVFVFCFGTCLLLVDLRDGRSIATPLQWYPRMRNATQAQRENWVIDGAAWGIHWPDIDEDLSVEGMLDGRPAVGWDRT